MALDIKPIHPFPARMAPDILWDQLRSYSKNTIVLDPMSGSGTTLVAAKMLGLRGIGFDTDPLAVLLARGWCTDVDPNALVSKARDVLIRARKRARRMRVSEAYPSQADDETRRFTRYWFDSGNRIQLSALAKTIRLVRDPTLRDLLWCSFSRLIITKTAGVSRAMDVSHSRPHRAYDKAPVRAFDRFDFQVSQITRALSSLPIPSSRHATVVNQGDARALPRRSNSVDLIMTSPPYLNAIDYMRGHRLSLVWMGYRLEDLRTVRATNVGTEASGGGHDFYANLVAESIQGSPTSRLTCMATTFAHDLDRVLAECWRVLRPSGKAIFVVGDSNNRGAYVKNSKILQMLAQKQGFDLIQVSQREIPPARRYLPPPTSRPETCSLGARLREESVITLKKANREESIG